MDEAHKLVQALITLQNYSRRLDAVRGKLLWQLKGNNLYREAFGEGIDTWEEFLRTPEISLTTSEANRMMQLYEYFMVKCEMTEEDLETVPIKSLHHILPKVKSGEIADDEVPDLIEAARALTFNQFKERLYDVKHGEGRTYQYVVMRRCNETGNLSRVQEITNEEILSVWPNLENYA